MSVDTTTSNILRTNPAQPEELQALAKVADEAQTELNRAIDALDVTTDALWDYQPTPDPQITKIAGALKGVEILLRRISERLDPLVLCDERERTAA